MPLPPIIAWDYLFAPNAQKSRLYLYLTETPFSICQQPFALPRPDLTDLGITYRRVPVLSIGKDVFPDNASFLEAMQMLLEKEGKALKEGPWDKALEAWGYRSFWLTLPCLPAEFVTPELAKDRAALFPVFAREDFGILQESARSELRAFLQGAEEGFLRGKNEGPFVAGESKPSMADVYAMWMVKWWIETVGVDVAGLGKDDLPRIWRWAKSLPVHAEEEKKRQKLSSEAASEQLLSSNYAMPDIGVHSDDTLNVKSGDWTAVEPSDAKPGTHPQFGKLIGLNKTKTVIELKNGLRLHFPKVGYFVRKAEESNGSS